MISSDLPILYSFRRCPFAMRARMGLYLAGQPVRLREVVLRDKPAEMLDASPKGTVPVMVLPEGEVIEESLDIMLWALERSGPQGILPDEPDRAAVLGLISRFDGVNETTKPKVGSFKYHLDRYKYASRHVGAEADIERTAALEHLKVLEAGLERAFLAGDRPGLTDCAIAPFVRQFAHTDKEWFEGLPLPAVQGWLQRMLSSECFTIIMKKYPQWQEGYEEPVLPVAPPGPSQD